MSPVVSIQFFKVSQGKSDKCHLIIPRRPALVLSTLFFSFFFPPAHQIRRTRQSSLCFADRAMEKLELRECFDQSQGQAKVRPQIKHMVSRVKSEFTMQRLSIIPHSWLPLETPPFTAATSFQEAMF